MRQSLVSICPAATRSDLLALGDAYGVAGGMSVELSATGNAPATHYGSHAWATPEFIAIVKQQVTVPVEGYTPEEVAAILSACTFSATQEPGPINRAHFDQAIAAMGLQTIQVDLP